jgi:hypothetical protein
MRYSIRNWVAIASILTAVYCASYFALSRHCFHQASQHNAEGFWFVQPQANQGIWPYCLNEVCRIGYWPLIYIDNAIGTGKPPAEWPMDCLS